MAPERIGRYRIVRRLGSGGTAEVYEALDEELGRRVALKGLVAERDGSSRRERLRREALSVQALSHPAVAQVYETFDDGERLWVVMEHIPGRSLAEIVARGPLPPVEVARIGAEVADALAAAHRAGIIHRDVKAENVMVTPEGAVKVVDFGFAKWQRPIEPNPAKLTEDGLVVGTARAMSPEQATGRELDHRSDIFSLGSLLYELASGHSPFRTATPLDTMYRVARGEFAPLRRAAPAFPRALAGIVEKCMRPHPDDRYADAGEVATDLRAAAPSGDPAAAGQPAQRRLEILRTALRYWWIPVTLAALGGGLALVMP
jgi:serine/threonine protein kinase